MKTNKLRLQVGKNRLVPLLLQWEEKHKLFNDWSGKPLNEPNGKLDCSRYDGIATAYRWCIEDLKKLL